MIALPLLSSQNRLIGLAIIACFASAGAQTTPAPSTSLPQASAAPSTGTIAIDGKLDESAWASATPIRDFHQQQPVEGVAPTQRTEVRVLYDERALYIGARMYDSRIDIIIPDLIYRMMEDFLLLFFLMALYVYYPYNFPPVLDVTQSQQMQPYFLPADDNIHTYIMII